MHTQTQRNRRGYQTDENSQSCGTNATTAFICAIGTNVADNVTFKLLCDAFPGLGFIFVSTVSPILLALLLIVTTMVSRRFYRLNGTEDNYLEGTDSIETTQTQTPHDLHVQQTPPSPSLNQPKQLSRWTWFRIPYWLKPSRTELKIALLDQSVTLLATAGGSNTPGHVQVMLNQSMIPLTAVFSSLAFERVFSTLQIAASLVLVMGCTLVSIGALSNSNDEHDSSSSSSSDDVGTKAAHALGSDHYDHEALFSRGASMFLFFLAQIPNASTSVWRESVLKNNAKETVDPNLPYLTILQLATRIGLARAVLSLLGGLFLSIYSPNVVGSELARGFGRFLPSTYRSIHIYHEHQHQRQRTTSPYWLVVNSVAWILTKLSMLWVSMGAGGAFLSCIAAAIALPLELMVFCTLTAESPTVVSWLGLFTCLVGLGLYRVASPEEFSTEKQQANVRNEYRYDTVACGGNDCLPPESTMSEGGDKRI